MLILSTVSIACFSLALFAFQLPNKITYAKQPAKSLVVLNGPVGKTVIDSKKTTLPQTARIKIPKILVDATLEQVGLTKKGEVDVPKRPQNAAWFNGSVKPGQKGSSVIVGHYGPWKNGLPTVFNRLNQLKKGDRITMEDENGLATHFIVRERRAYDANTNPIEVFWKNDDASHLNLITCDGKWDPVSKSYPRRLVVFADKE